ncbi:MULTISPECIES: helix-turn-helix transcriptional regulator [unclassified Saccharopolyspora]|uniref:helix-turn-helix domain-containing protein n=1 Tax=unclassified Saccharopolyspora TaxID=2646250 RepID=UPI001CD78333|nr:MULTISPECIES: helix-turn-helix transcriptional regulator [unclassified Saccharopolyspora]MCA1190296.1 helix-turn-helix transcriptional regulator [Saccharopolyspora sp. 6T]MCA1196016.1 helix-turn-helix transcriptional regulator [Saccharopolyspora sp. 6V]MCA1229355.1 helix-turn-helix transcriptional regulator [Saccharopolyspora sp. 6M]MCA1283243.1 helix-turn-helix transcriptional regulator [Saccharopolyspora sp. 7B]
MSTSPTALKRWIAGELARLRERKGASRAEAAKAIRGSIQNIGHFEVGRRMPKPLELETLLRFYGVPDRIDFFLSLRDRSRKSTDWWVRFDSEEALPDYLKLFLGIEIMAEKIESWDTHVVPGLFQTRAYADAIMQGGAPKLRKKDRERRVELRMARQQEVLGNGRTPVVHAVLSEACLHHLNGGRAVHTEQLAALLEWHDEPNVEIRVLPFAAGLLTGVDGAFMLLSYPPEFDHELGTAYVENRIEVLYYEEPGAVAPFRTAFDQLKVKALKPSDSRELIARVLEEHA